MKIRVCWSSFSVLWPEKIREKANSFRVGSKDKRCYQDIAGFDTCEKMYRVFVFISNILEWWVYKELSNSMVKVIKLQAELDGDDNTKRNMWFVQMTPCYLPMTLPILFLSPWCQSLLSLCPRHSDIPLIEIHSKDTNHI